MKCTVIKHFIDKDTLINYVKGDTFESTDLERVSFLSKKGFIKEVDTPKEQKKTGNRTRKKASEIDAGES